MIERRLVGASIMSTRKKGRILRRGEVMVELDHDAIAMRVLGWWNPETMEVEPIDLPPQSQFQVAVGITIAPRD